MIKKSEPDNWKFKGLDRLMWLHMCGGVGGYHQQPEEVKLATTAFWFENEPHWCHV